jgi:hypothetical protein
LPAIVVAAIAEELVVAGGAEQLVAVLRADHVLNRVEAVAVRPAASLQRIVQVDGDARGGVHIGDRVAARAAVECLGHIAGTDENVVAAIAVEVTTRSAVGPDEVVAVAGSAPGRRVGVVRDVHGVVDEAGVGAGVVDHRLKLGELELGHLKIGHGSCVTSIAGPNGGA